MSIIKTRFSVVAMLVLLFSACQKKQVMDVVPEGPGHIAETVTASIDGRVLDDQGVPVSGASVKAGTASASTDVNGNFRFTGIAVDKHAALVKVEKAGYFTGIRTLSINNEKESSFTVVKLIKKTLAGTVEPAAGGSVQLPGDKGSILFAANSFVVAGTTTAYTGTVSVNAAFIDPTASDFSEILPGALRAISADNNETGLISYAMMAVELQGSGGEKLQLAANRKATLRFAIPDALAAQAPATIPLWYLDEGNGLWKEEGSAARNGKEYVGDVGHFSFWNCDAPFPVVDLRATIKTASDAPLSYVRVEIVAASGSQGNISGTGYTNSAGGFGGLVPKNTALLLKVYNPCGEVMFTQTIDPLQRDTDLGALKLAESSQSVVVSGTATDCANTSIATGFVDVRVGTQIYRGNISNGAYSLSFPFCESVSGNVTVTAHDTETSEQSDPKTVPITGNTVQTGNLVVCGNTADEYVYFSIDGQQYGYSLPPDSITYNYYNWGGQLRTTVDAFPKTGSGNSIYWVMDGPSGPGTHALSNLEIRINSRRSSLADTSVVNVTSYTPGSGYLEGSFTTRVVMDSSGSGRKPVTASFRIKQY
ncbi:MAG: carboxypeptidase-like regulatory domain-containing protein [Flavihumibacter sp.]